MTSETGLRVDDVVVSFGSTRVLDGVDLAVARGTISALLGPSGCGKTTLLRVVAGLQRPDAGGVRWNGQALGNVPTHRRPVGLMFQDHALFPHRNVGSNVAFGLEMAGIGTAERTDRVEELLELVGLGGVAARDVGDLSGGEAQRVALARALAPRPEVLLLDEPFGSLDRPLRERLVEDIRRIVVDLGITALHVTHDHDEAFSIADQLSVMHRGRLLITGTPGAVRRSPGSELVARFLGLDNVLEPHEAALLGISEDRTVVLDPRHVRVAASAEAAELQAGETSARARVVSSRYRAGDYLVTAALPGGTSVVATAQDRPAPGTEITLVVDPGAARPLEAPT